MSDIITDKEISIFFEDDDYSNALATNLSEFQMLSSYLKKPTVSTQHGVKGEGHESVCFIAEDSSSPPVRMYQFFKLLSYNNVSFPDFQKFYYDYFSEVRKIEKDLGCKITELKSPAFKEHEDSLSISLEKNKGGI